MASYSPNEQATNQLLRVLSWIHKSNRAVTEPTIYKCVNGHRGYFPECLTCLALKEISPNHPQRKEAQPRCE